MDNNIVDEESSVQEKDIQTQNQPSSSTASPSQSIPPQNKSMPIAINNQKHSINPLFYVPPIAGAIFLTASIIMILYFLLIKTKSMTQLQKWGPGSYIIFGTFTFVILLIPISLVLLISGLGTLRNAKQEQPSKGKNAVRVIIYSILIIAELLLMATMLKIYIINLN